MTDVIQKLDAALIVLLNTKTEQEITTSDLCELAKISQSTFYEYYSDLTSMKEAFCQRVKEQLLHHPHTAEDFTWIFDYIKGNIDVFNAYFKLPYSGKHGDYKELFFCKGAFSMIKLWFEEGCKESPKQMGDILKREHDKILK